MKLKTLITIKETLELQKEQAKADIKEANEMLNENYDDEFKKHITKKLNETYRKYSDLMDALLDLRNHEWN